MLLARKAKKNQDMEDQVGIAIKFWEKTLESSAYFHKRGDEAVKFYIGVNTALAAWLLTNGANSPTLIFAVMVLGVFGTGHVVYSHNRGFRLQQRANRIAREISQILHLSDSIKVWDSSDNLKFKNIIVLGHPAAQVIFNALIVLCISFVYAFVLLLKILGG